MHALLRSLADAIPLRSVSKRDRDLLHTARTELLPPGFESTDAYVPSRRIGHAGFSLHVDRQRSWLAGLDTPEMHTLFAALRAHPEINTGHDGQQFADRGLIHNRYYPTPDAEIYAAMIATHRPTRVLEVGSGYSTVVARTTVDHVGLDTRIDVIDPHPRRDIEGFAHGVEYAKVEASSLGANTVESGSILFIDSSHVCRSEGDLPFLFCQVLPELPAGVVVHVHDVFTPYDYPDNYYERFYTEQYLLQALLATSARFEVVFATHFMSRDHGDDMRRVFGDAVGRDPLFHGASFWMQTV